MSEDDARRSAGLIFHEVPIWEQWYRVDQVELDEPLPVMGAR
jgi:hypothetical protein